MGCSRFSRRYSGNNESCISHIPSIWKRTIETISRRDDECVLVEYAEEKQRRNRPIVRFPVGRANFGELLCCSSLAYHTGTLRSSRRESPQNSLRQIDGICETQDVCSLFLRLLKCFTSPSALSACAEQWKFVPLGYPIRKSSDHRLLHTSPKRIAVTPRPSSPFLVKASTIRPY